MLKKTAKKLTKENPHSAANNAEAYESFTETLFFLTTGLTVPLICSRETFFCEI